MQTQPLGRAALFFLHININIYCYFVLNILLIGYSVKIRINEMNSRCFHLQAIMVLVTVKQTKHLLGKVVSTHTGEDLIVLRV